MNLLDVPNTDAQAAFVRRDLDRRRKAKAWPKHGNSGGPGGGARMMDADVVAGMHAVYCQTKSLAKTGKAFGRTKQAMSFIFKSHGLATRQRGGNNRK